MLNMIVGAVIIHDEVYGCIIEERDDCEDFLHLFNGDCYNACEVDSYVAFPEIGHIYTSDAQDRLKQAYEEYRSKR